MIEMRPGGQATVVRPQGDEVITKPSAANEEETDGR